MIQRHQRLRLAGVLFLALLVTPSAMADVWYVNKAAASGGDGTSWALAFQTIQPAIDAAAVEAGGGEVWIAAGLYDEVREPEFGALLLRENVAVYGGFSGSETQRSERDWELHKVVISGEKGLAGGIAVHTVRPESSSRLDGVTVSRSSQFGIWMQNVHSITLENLYFFGGNVEGLSLAVHAYDVSNLYVRGSLVERCKGGPGTPVFEMVSVSNLQIVDTVFTRNSGSFFAGALILNGCEDALVEGCVFKENSAGAGGAMYIYASPTELCDDASRFPQVQNCLFVENSATFSGGGNRCISHGYLYRQECRGVHRLRFLLRWYL